MGISRKDFLRSSLLLSGALFVSTKKLSSFTKLLEEDNLKILRGNIGIFTGDGGTIGWYANDDGVVVIDSQFPEYAKQLHTGLKKRNSRNIDILFNTHHHRDHTAGNYYFKDIVKRIVAQENCPKLQKKRNEKPGEEDKQVYANETFKETWSEQLGKQKITAYHFGAAHTGGDAVYHFENENVVHMGDIIFNEAYPYIDVDADCTLVGWPKYIEEVLKKFDNDTLFIYGHGPSPEKSFGNKESLKKMIDYINTLHDFAGKEFKVGKTKEEFAENKSIPGVTERTELWQGALKHNLEASYRFVSEKK